MPNENRIIQAKTFANRLQETMLIQFSNYKLKRCLALELVATWYKYKNYSELQSSRVERTISVNYWDLIQQVVSIIRVHPSLGITESDLDFDDNFTPYLLGNGSMMIAQFIIAPVHGATSWETLVCSTVPSQELKKLTGLHAQIVGPTQAIQSVTEHFITQFEFDAIEYARKQDSYPWDKWEKRAIEAGIDQETATLGRAAYRESYQHAWSEELKLFCGLYDDGEILMGLAKQHPEKVRKVLRYLLNNYQ